MTFEKWMDKVNEAIAQVLGGLTTEDIPDWDYWQAWRDGMRPAVAAIKALKAARM